nr:hypothetical protein [uncultured Roseococcus sp.]
MSLLADFIVAEAGGRLDRHVHGAFSQLGDWIKRVRRVALTSDARQFGRILCKRPSQASLIAEALFPHSQEPLWIEWKQERLGPIQYGADDGSLGQKPTADRVGVLFLPLGGGATMMTMAWSFYDQRHGGGICPSALIRDAHPDITFGPLVDKLWRDMGYPGRPTRELISAPQIKADLKRWNAAATPQDVAATIEEAERTAVIPHPWLLQYLAGLPPQASRQVVASSWEDLQGDAGLACEAAALFLTGALQQNSADLDGINRARRKARKPELLQHEVWDVDRKLGKALRAAGHSADEVEQHLVGGHFKRRATGVFWWRPHIRGQRQDAAA